jgi:hypothetical protein
VLIGRAAPTLKGMRSKPAPLLCELHSHTTWSDGTLSVRELCDLYGRSGFDVLAVTDHVVRGDDLHVTSRNFDTYLAELVEEGRRARELYDLLVVPGVELTYEDPDQSRAAHALAVGLREFVGVRDGLEVALTSARRHGAALVAAHPYPLAEAASSSRGTGAWQVRHAELAPLVDRWELLNRDTPFRWVAEQRLPVIASGDFHRPEHLTTWKTALPCAKDERGVVGYLRSSRPAYLVRPETSEAALGRAA